MIFGFTSPKVNDGNENNQLDVYPSVVGQQSPTTALAHARLGTQTGTEILPAVMNRQYIPGDLTTSWLFEILKRKEMPVFL